MIVQGFALEHVATGEELLWWDTIPGTVFVPGVSITVDAAAAGWEAEGYRIVERAREIPDPTPIVPNVITDRQFGDALYRMSVITHAERMAFGKVGDVPAALAAIIAVIPDEEQRKDAEYLVSTAQTFERRHPMTRMLQQAMGWTDEQVDALWTLGASL